LTKLYDSHPALKFIENVKVSFIIVSWTMRKLASWTASGFS